MAHITIRIDTEGKPSEYIRQLADNFSDSVAQVSEVDDVTVTVVEPSRTVKIGRDVHPSNPREDQENVGVMFCKHDRYDLGDKGAADPIVKYGYVDLGGYKLYDTGNSWDETDDPPDDYTMFNDVLGLLEEIAENYEQLIDGEDSISCGVAGIVHREAAEWLRAHEWQTEHVLRDDIALCLPLYLYDHSGITISHGDFGDRWDSGQVGWHYITKESVKKNWLDYGYPEPDLREVLKAELKEYDCFLQGNVWYFEIKDEEGNEVESGSTFYGDGLEETGILDNIEKELHEAAREAWERRFD